jgi:uncharacterized protein (TIGR04141 family)
MAADKPKVDLSIYLAKTASTDLAAPIKKSGALRKHKLTLAKNCEAVLFVRRPTSNPPKWAKFFGNHLDTKAFGQNASTGAVLSVPLNRKTLLVALGQGWHSIDTAKIEPDFGLKTALNLLDDQSIRSIDKATLEAQPKQLREQAGRATEIQSFGIDVERDLLRAVAGIPRDKAYGSRISGLDSLRLSIDVVPEDLPRLLKNFLVAYNSNRYKNGPFSWIDHIGLVRDADVRTKLMIDLLKKLNARELDRMWLSLPEVIDWNRVAGFRYSMARKEPRVYDIRVSEFLDTFKEKQITEADLTRRKIYCVDADEMPVLERPALNYLYAEIPKGNDIFVLNNSNWYCVENNYANSINSSFQKIPQYQKALPDYDDDTEGAYNARVAQNQPGEFVLLDQDLAHIPAAASPIEICDLYRTVKEFIHVKRYGGSSVLSHLFNQGLVSGEMFQMDSGYRGIVNDKLPEDHKLEDSNQRPQPNEFKVVYAIISESDEPLSIPFFSKVSVKNCASRLMAMGFDVRLAKISVVEARKKTKKYAPGPNKI